MREAGAEEKTAIEVGELREMQRQDRMQQQKETGGGEGGGGARQKRMEENS